MKPLYKCSVLVKTANFTQLQIFVLFQDILQGPKLTLAEF